MTLIYELVDLLYYTIDMDLEIFGIEKNVKNMFGSEQIGCNFY